MPFLKRFFQKKEILPPINFGDFITDIHSHLIPGIDDGSKSLKETVVLLQKFQEMGFRNVITTPHVMCDAYRNTPEIILTGRDNVRNEIKAQGIDIHFSAAAEYNHDDGFTELITQGNLLKLINDYLLFELPFFTEPMGIWETVFDLTTSGYKPILAHPERYVYYHKDFQKLIDYKEKGVLFQVNLLSLTNHYGEPTRKTAEKLIDMELIDFVGTDCHRIEHLHKLEYHARLPYFHKLVNSDKILNKHLV